MGDFAFIIHPIELGDIWRRFKFMRHWPVPVVETVVKALPPLKISEITGISSPYARTSGYLLACPFTSQQMVSLPEAKVLSKIIRTGKIAEKAGAKIVGLGAMSSLIGDAGITVSANLNIAVTTGKSYSVATALQGTLNAAQLMGVDLSRAEVLVLGATGSVGGVCARILAREVRFLTLLARNKTRLAHLSAAILRETGLAVKITSDESRAVRRADIVVAISGSSDVIIDVMDLRPGCIVCDITRPRDVARRVAQLRDDILVIEGTVIRVPGHTDFGFDFGFPPGCSNAGMAETIILAMEGRYENFSLGRDLTVAQVDEISALAQKHGFMPVGLYSFGRVLTPGHIAGVAARRQTRI